jgi:hypothetical protein
MVRKEVGVFHFPGHLNMIHLCSNNNVYVRAWDSFLLIVSFFFSFKHESVCLYMLAYIRNNVFQFLCVEILVHIENKIDISITVHGIRCGVKS